MFHNLAEFKGLIVAELGLEIHLSDAKARCSLPHHGSKSKILMNWCWGWGWNQRAPCLEFSWDGILFFLNVSSMTQLLSKFYLLDHSAVSTSLWRLSFLPSSLSSSSTTVGMAGFSDYPGSYRFIPNTWINLVPAGKLSASKVKDYFLMLLYLPPLPAAQCVEQ